MLGASISLNQYNELKDSKIGDKIAIIDNWNENDVENEFVNQNIDLYYANFVIKTKVSNQLINTESKLPSYELRSNYRDEPEFHDLGDDPYQSIELEVTDIIIPINKDNINEQARLDYMGSKEYAMHIMMRNSGFTYS